MKKPNQLFLLTILLVGCILFQSCLRAGPPRKEFEKMVKMDKIAREIEERVRGYTTACNKLDEDYMKGFWADTSDFLFAGDGTITSNDEWRAKLDGLFDGIKEFTKIEFPKLEVMVYSENSASCCIEFEWSYINIEGETISSHGSWLYVFTIIEDEWRVVHSAGTHIPG